MDWKAIALAYLVMSIFAIPITSSTETFDHSVFDRILKEYVDEKGRIDYNGIAKDERFASYIDSLKDARVEEMSRDEQLAFWLNAYNAITIDKVIKWKPKKSVRESAFGWISTKFFRTKEHIVAGMKMSQDYIEHGILRKEFDEPRVHFALICASSSCPPQPRYAFTGESVREQLESETRKYLNFPRGTKIDRDKNTLYISKIFNWYEEDFIRHSGSVMDFIRPYLEEETLEFLNDKPRIKYLDYDWALNAQEPLR